MTLYPPNQPRLWVNNDLKMGADEIGISYGFRITPPDWRTQATDRTKRRRERIAGVTGCQSQTHRRGETWHAREDYGGSIVLDLCCGTARQQ